MPMPDTSRAVLRRWPRCSESWRVMDCLAFVKEIKIGTNWKRLRFIVTSDEHIAALDMDVVQNKSHPQYGVWRIEMLASRASSEMVCLVSIASYHDLDENTKSMAPVGPRPRPT